RVLPRHRPHRMAERGEARPLVRRHVRGGPPPSGGPARPAMIDRRGPTLRPRAFAVRRRRWERLLFLPWPVPADELRPLIPAGLNVDTHDGQAWIGLVPFVVRSARPVFLPPVPGVSSFAEVNVRTYVHDRGRDPGVWFFSLDAASRVAVAAARAFFKLG